MAKSASVVALLRKLSIDSWLRAHGKFVRPELTKKQKQELKECFDLIDLDGSGAIDASELHTAFSVLGMRVKRSEVERMLDEVDEDGSGEVEYPEFVQIMTTKLETQTQEVEEEAKTKVQPLPFQLLAQAYRRKKLMEAVMGGDKAAQERLRAKAEEAEAERLVVLAAMEAEKQDPTLRYDEKSIRTLSDIKYQKLRKAQTRKKHIPEGPLPQYVVQNLDEDVKEALIEMNEDPHFIVKSGHPDAKSTKRSGEETPVPQTADVAFDEVINVPEEIKPISMSTQIQSLYKDDLIDFGRHRTKVRHKPVLEQQMLHLRAIKSIQEFVKTKET